MLRLLVDFHGVLRHTRWFVDENKKRQCYAEPVPGSQQAIRKLSQYYEIALVSSAQPETISYICEFVEFYFPEIAFENQVFTYSKHYVIGDVIIDDSPSNLVQSPCGVRILFGGEPNSNYIQMYNWKDVTNYLIGLAAGVPK